MVLVQKGIHSKINNSSILKVIALLVIIFTSIFFIFSYYYKFLTVNNSFSKIDKQENHLESTYFENTLIKCESRECSMQATSFDNLASITNSKEQTVPPIKKILANIIPNVTRIRFASTFEGTIRMKLIAPNGITFGPDALGDVAAYEVNKNSEVYEILNPQAGTWEIQLIGYDLPTAKETVKVAVLVMDRLPDTTNIKPIANAGGPYKALANEEIILKGNLSFDPVGLTKIFEWDLDGDGDFELSSEDPFTPVKFDKPGTYQIILRVTDDGGLSSTAQTTVTITN